MAGSRGSAGHGVGRRQLWRARAALLRAPGGHCEGARGVERVGHRPAHLQVHLREVRGRHREGHACLIVDRCVFMFICDNVWK